MARTLRRRVSIGRRRKIEDPEIIIIPMIDVMMFLLFFFMVASLAMVVQNAIAVQLPKASTGKDQNVERLAITIQADGKIFLNLKPTSIASLERDLETAKAGPNTSVTLNADSRAPYGLVVAAMDEARKAGVPGFAFAINRR